MNNKQTLSFFETDDACVRSGAGASAIQAHRTCRAALAALMLAAACLLVAPAVRADATDNHDPHEKLNRKIMKLNDGIDFMLLRPVARTYNFCTPHFARQGVRNFFDNLNEPNTLANNLLQGKLKQGGRTISRFVINSTIGVVGIFDVAKHWKLERHEQDLGTTFGVWGLGEGSYHVLPLLGPSTTRDNPWQAIQVVLGVTSFPVSLIDMASQRAAAEDDIKTMDKMAVDRYVFLREAYRQHRNFQIHGEDQGPPPMSQLVLDDAGADSPASAPKAAPAASPGTERGVRNAEKPVAKSVATAPTPPAARTAPAARPRTTESALHGPLDYRPALPQQSGAPGLRN